MKSRLRNCEVIVSILNVNKTVRPISRLRSDIFNRYYYSPFDEKMSMNEAIALRGKCDVSYLAVDGKTFWLRTQCL